MIEFDIRRLTGALQKLAKTIDKQYVKDGFIRGEEVSIFQTQAWELKKTGEISEQQYYSIFDRYYDYEMGNVSLIDKDDPNRPRYAYENFSIDTLIQDLTDKLPTVEADLEKADRINRHNKMVSNLVESWNNKYNAKITVDLVEKLYSSIEILDLTVDSKEWDNVDKNKYPSKEDYIVDKMLAIMANESRFDPTAKNSSSGTTGLMQMSKSRLNEIREKNPTEAGPGGKFSVKTLDEFAKLSMEEQLDYFIEGLRICKKYYSHIDGPVTVEQVYQMNHYPSSGKNIASVNRKNEVIYAKMQERGDLPLIT